MTISHPGIDYFNKVSLAIEDPNKLRHHLNEQRCQLSNRLSDQEPRHRDPDMIKQLRTLEVACERANWYDPEHPNARAALKRAVEGKSSWGGFRDSAQYEREAAALHEQPRDRFTVKIRHDF
jgi:hypothetical protein